jgi:hypothetical protein
MLDMGDPLVSVKGGGGYGPGVLSRWAPRLGSARLVSDLTGQPAGAGRVEPVPATAAA